MLGVNGSLRPDGRGRAGADLGRRRGLDQPAGAELGISRHVPTVNDLYAIGRGLESYGVDGLLIIGGWTRSRRSAPCSASAPATRPSRSRPSTCRPRSATTSPARAVGGADSALGVIVDSVDRVRQAGIATRRCFVVETMGDQCGYLALLGGLSGGAVRVYLHEEGITLKELAHDIERMVESFRVGQRLFLAVMNEKASPMYTSATSWSGCSTRRARAVRRPRGGPRPDPAGRRAVAVRPDPRHPAGRALDRLAQQPDRERRQRRGADRAVRRWQLGDPAAGGRGAGRLGAPAPAGPVVDAAAAADRRVRRPALARLDLAALEGDDLAGPRRSSRRRGPRSGPRRRRRPRSARPGRRCGGGRWPPARWPSGRRRRPG